jgi:hypothetical protein
MHDARDSVELFLQNFVSDHHLTSGLLFLDFFVVGVGDAAACVALVLAAITVLD